MILVGTRHWSGLVSWLREHFADTAMITDADAARLVLTDDPAEVAELVQQAWREQPRSLSPAHPAGAPT